MSACSWSTGLNGGDAKKFDMIYRYKLPDGSPENWTCQQVADYLRRRTLHKAAKVCEEEEIDGRAFLNLREDHLLNRFKLLLGPALNLIELIRQLNAYFSDDH